MCELLEVTRCHTLLEGPEQPSFVKTKCVSRNVEEKKCRGPGMDRTSAGSFRVVGRGMSPKRACLDWISGRLADA